ncbi:45145_t:CDS:10, partial [Gigaspora margarita]
VEHTLVSKFVSYVAENADENWRKVASILNEDGVLRVSLVRFIIDTHIDTRGEGIEKKLAMKLPPVGFFLNLREGQGQLVLVLRTTRSFASQAQWESTKSFWCDVELEKIEKEKQLIEKKIDQTEMQFGLDQSLAGNEAQVILNKTKLGNLLDRRNSKRKDTHTGKDDTDALTSPTEKDEIDSFFQSSTNATMKRPKLDEKNVLNEEGPTNEGIELETHKKAKKATSVDSETNTLKSKNASETSTRNNNEKSSEQSSSSDLGPEGVEEIKLDFVSIEKELLWEQSNEFLFMLDRALSSVIVLNSPCPYPGHIFTNREWRAITSENPYVITEPVLPSDVCFSLWNSLAEFMEDKAPFLSLRDSEIGRVVSRIFNDMYSSVPKVSPTKTSEDEHCFKLLHPIIRPLFFTDSCKEYIIQLNRTTSCTATRPNFSCLVNDIPILNSEIKPPRFTPLQGQKDKLKIQLRARKSINQLLRTKGGLDEAVLLTNQKSHIMDLKYDGLYRSWPFLTTQLVKNKMTIPLMESNIRHMKALEELISKIAENYNSRGCQNETTLLQIGYMRDLPNSPQIKKILSG